MDLLLIILVILFVLFLVGGIAISGHLLLIGVVVVLIIAAFSYNGSGRRW